eukprot:15467678-Alexandrium_andersonii.AAC.1
MQRSAALEGATAPPGPPKSAGCARWRHFLGVGPRGVTPMGRPHSKLLQMAERLQRFAAPVARLS